MTAADANADADAGGDAAWIAKEDALRPRVRIEDAFRDPPRTFGGFDVAYANPARDDPAVACSLVARGALVLLDAATLGVLDTVSCEAPVGGAYAPGFLARREFPILRAVWDLAREKPDVLFVDGGGTLHPRRIGSATYAGAALDVPTIGITKSPFIGTVGPRASGQAEVREGDELLGHALWPANGVGKPIFVSAGHRVSQAAALRLAFHARRPGERLPEPIRAADAAGRGAMRENGGPP